MSPPIDGHTFYWLFLRYIFTWVEIRSSLGPIITRISSFSFFLSQTLPVLEFEFELVIFSVISHFDAITNVKWKEKNLSLDKNKPDSNSATFSANRQRERERESWKLFMVWELQVHMKVWPPVEVKVVAFLFPCVAYLDVKMWMWMRISISRLLFHSRKLSLLSHPLSLSLCFSFPRSPSSYNCMWLGGTHTVAVAAAHIECILFISERSLRSANSIAAQASGPLQWLSLSLSLSLRISCTCSGSLCLFSLLSFHSFSGKYKSKNQRHEVHFELLLVLLRLISPSNRVNHRTLHLTCQKWIGERERVLKF